MSRNLWNECHGSEQIELLQTQAWRFVEAQHITSTRKLVDTLDEQILLEEMIDDMKPNLPDGYAIYHPLLYTPFRYPPLQHGSRFGKYYEGGIWYGSLEQVTAMAEKAFYQFNFLRASSEDLGMVTISLTSFSVNVVTGNGIDLTRSAFDSAINEISSPVAYDTSQELGGMMRSANVEAFIYQSARDAAGKLNIGVFTPFAFKQKKPDAKSLQSWQCMADQQTVEFMRSSAITPESFSFPLQQFLVNGRLPFPAI